MRMPHIATRLSFAPDGKSLAVGGGGNDMHIYDTADGKLAANCPGHTGLVLCASHSPDGKLLASGAMVLSTIKIWNPSSRQELRTLMGHSDWVYCVAFAPDGKTLASAGREGSVILWDASTGQRRATIACTAGRRIALPFLPMDTLASSSPGRDR